MAEARFITGSQFGSVMSVTSTSPGSTRAISETLRRAIDYARSGVPVARLVAVEPKAKRPLGFARGEIWIADDFDAPLPDDLLKLFYGGEIPKLESNSKKKRTGRRK